MMQAERFPHPPIPDSPAAPPALAGVAPLPVPWRRKCTVARADVFALTPLEQLLLWSARRWRHGRHRWDQVEREFARLWGTGWQDALLAWDGLLDLAHADPCRLPDIRNGCAVGLSLTERALLTLGLTATDPATGPRPQLLLARLLSPVQREEALALLARMRRQEPPSAAGMRS